METRIQQVNDKMVCRVTLNFMLKESSFVKKI